MDSADEIHSPPAAALELTGPDFRALGEYRYQIRRFLHFSERAARAEGLEPQQHQLMLAVKALSVSGEPTIGKLAENLLIRHHSAVGLVDRLEDRGFVERVRSEADRRQVRVRLTPEGEAKLSHLALAHRAELRVSGPMLVEVLHALLERLPAESIAPPADGEAPAQQEEEKDVLSVQNRHA
ncbi:MAG TPA: MarR family transcriptional regulator [Bryobacteraceae bacterium]|nr:MarR family transcriptional regulator [Bryobacteraceae bacterium]